MVTVDSLPLTQLEPAAALEAEDRLYVVQSLESRQATLADLLRLLERERLDEIEALALAGI